MGCKDTIIILIFNSLRQFFVDNFLLRRRYSKIRFHEAVFLGKVSEYTPISIKALTTFKKPAAKTFVFALDLYHCAEKRPFE